MKEKSCGALVFNKDGNVLIIHSVMGHYDIPKGHVESDETDFQTAIREIKEETGVDVKINENVKPYKVTYTMKNGITKDVYYYLADALSGNIKAQEEEVSSAKFISLKDALNILTFDNTKNTVKYFADELGLKI